MERLKQEEVALTQETRSKLIQLAQANGWVGMKGMIEKTKTHSDIAQ